MCGRMILHLYKCNDSQNEVFMEKIGIIKDIDNLGRLQIPKDIRQRLGITKKVQLVVTDEGLLIKNDEYKLVKISEGKDV